MDPTAKVKNEDGSYNASASFSSTISNPNLMFGDVKDQGDRSETLDAELMRSLTNVEGGLKVAIRFDFTFSLWFRLYEQQYPRVLGSKECKWSGFRMVLRFS